MKCLNIPYLTSSVFHLILLLVFYVRGETKPYHEIKDQAHTSKIREIGGRFAHHRNATTCASREWKSKENPKKMEDRTPQKRDSTPSPTSEGSQQCEGREPRPSTRRSGTPTKALKTSAFRRSTPERARAASTPRPRTTRLRPLPGACFESASFNCLHTLKKMRAVCILAPASKRDPSRENTNRLTRVTRCVSKRSNPPPLCPQVFMPVAIPGNDEVVKLAQSRGTAIESIDRQHAERVVQNQQKKYHHKPSWQESA